MSLPSEQREALRVSIKSTRIAERWICAGLVCLSVFAYSAEPQTQHPSVILVIGAPGEPEYGSNFLHQAAAWRDACGRAGADCLTIGVEYPAGTNDHDLLQATLAELPKEGPAPVWLVLIGHGNFDGKEAWFNLRGPDFSATELGDWIRPLQRPLAIIDTSSASGPFVAQLSGTNRVVVTATRSGNEQNFARFGQFFAEAITDPRADIDQDGQVSLLEAFLSASHEVNEFYKAKGRLVTEHAMIDDNGDGLGTPAEWFRGVRAIRQAKDGASVDGALAQQFCLLPSAGERALTPEQIQQRNELETQIAALREKKSQMAEDEYYQRLEGLLLRIAGLYPATPAAPAAP